MKREYHQQLGGFNLADLRREKEQAFLGTIVEFDVGHKYAGKKGKVVEIVTTIHGRRPKVLLESGQTAIVFNQGDSHVVLSEHEQG